ncbi:MAG: HD-GYP domain-containing protein [Candidatus Xenobia bacterium]
MGRSHAFGRRVKLYAGLLGTTVVALAAAGWQAGSTWTVHAAPWGFSRASILMDVVTFIVLAAAAEAWPIHLPRISGTINVADAVYLALILVAGPRVAVVVLLASALAKGVRLLRSGRHAVLALLGGLESTAPFLVGSLILDLTGHGLGTFVAVTGVVYGLLALETGVHRALESRIRFYLQMIPARRLAVQMALNLPLGLLMAQTREIDARAFVLLVLPLAVMLVTLRDYSELLDEARDTIEGLAHAVEKRNPSMQQHSDRVAELAEATARELRMREDEVEAIRSAGKLHDLGKISVADRILAKMEALDDDELEEIKRSPEVGGKVASSLSLFNKGENVGEIVRQHHEWFNGQGYPRGLAGEAILPGARILAVAEAFDSMTTDRTYRGALSVEQAKSELRAGAGQQFDPKVVEAILAVVGRREASKAEEVRRDGHGLSLWRFASYKQGTSQGPRASAAPATAGRRSLRRTGTG